MTWLKELSQDILLHRLLFSFLFGILIGLERQLRHKMSGIITNTLVSVGTTLFMIFAHQFSMNASARMAAQIISGIGFLGGGVIIRDGFSVRGINTAATLWCSAAIGLLCSEGYIRYALIGTAMILLANVALKPIAVWLENSSLGGRDVSFDYNLFVECTPEAEQAIMDRIRKTVTRHKGMIHGMECNASENGNYKQIRVHMMMYGKDDNPLMEMLGKIKKEHEILSYRYEKERS